MAVARRRVPLAELEGLISEGRNPKSMEIDLQPTEAILRVILPTASTGIFGALMLGFGRALGETMALAMLVGNSNQLSISLFSPANTLAALLALNFPEADKRQEQVLMFAAVILLAITLLVNICGAAILRRATARLSGGGK